MWDAGELSGAPYCVAFPSFGYPGALMFVGVRSGAVNGFLHLGFVVTAHFLGHGVSLSRLFPDSGSPGTQGSPLPATRSPGDCLP